MAVAKKHSSTPPPDGGWGWMIVIGCFLVTICTRAVTRCISIFFVEFQTYFAQDYARTAWIHSIVDCATMLCAPLGSFVSNHVSSQVGIMLGGLLASAGFILSSFATTLEHLYLSLGILTGLGFALSYSPAVAMVGNYFHKRKALAYGIAMSGCGIGTFILAPVVQLLIEHFSWRGALLILGGFVLNLCVCGALMRPIEGKEDHKNMLEFSEQEFELEAQTSGFKQWSFCSPMIKLWSHKCVCHCSQQEYNFVLMPDFVVLAVSILFMAYGCSPLFVYLVPYSLSVGVSHQQAAFLMSVLGVIDIIGNITFGWFTDQRCLKKYRYVCYLFAVAMDGLCCLFLPALQSFQLLLPFSFTFGYFDGAYITLIPVVTADVVGTASLSSALGMIYFLHAVPYLVSPPIAGWLVDTTGNYTASFLLCGFSMVLSSTLLCCARLAKITPTSSGPVGRDIQAKQESWTNGAIVYLVTGELDQRSEELLAGEPNSHSKR
ncbi:monocarboxylate transporter 12 [Protobothrops mucrosquamatus]|uniref:monocarboxylate transporter 12 n=1 Tax=Protobothrops mucrosquamatus TaxID=103944 RepID=UPI000775DEA1|nr:monocarboxylate transporter 12 [Protobothrops mucrosquamatus]